MADDSKTKTETDAKPAKKVKAQKFRCAQTPNGWVYLPKLDRRVMFVSGHYATSDPAEIEELNSDAMPHTELVAANSAPILDESGGVPPEVLEQLKKLKAND